MSNARIGEEHWEKTKAGLSIVVSALQIFPGALKSVVGIISKPESELACWLHKGVEHGEEML